MANYGKISQSLRALRGSSPQTPTPKAPLKAPDRIWKPPPNNWRPAPIASAPARPASRPPWPPGPEPSSGSDARRYRPGLDGLRALAVVGVLLYHAGVHWVPG